MTRIFLLAKRDCTRRALPSRGLQRIVMESRMECCLNDHEEKYPKNGGVMTAGRRSQTNVEPGWKCESWKNRWLRVTRKSCFPVYKSEKDIPAGNMGSARWSPSGRKRLHHRRAYRVLVSREYISDRPTDNCVNHCDSVCSHLRPEIKDPPERTVVRLCQI